MRGFQVLPRRWVVERSFAWWLRSRRLDRDYERRTDTSEMVILWSMTMLMSRRLAALGQGPGRSRYMLREHRTSYGLGPPRPHQRHEPTQPALRPTAVAV